MPDPALLPPRELLSILVPGAMNPRIHHPQWYKTVGAINEGELKLALNEPLNISPTFSQFQFGTPPVVISCQADFWQIQFTENKAWEQGVEIASAVFEKLGETPVSAVALTTQVHRDTSVTDVKELISRVLVNLNFGFPSGKSVGVDLTVNAVEDDSTVAMSIQASMLSERAVFVFYQIQYSPPPTVSGGHFDLGVLLKARVDSYLEKAAKAIDNAVDAVNALATQ